MSNKAFFRQVGGSHYKKYKIQPSRFINDNKILFAEGNAIKYICRHQGQRWQARFIKSDSLHSDDSRKRL
jgi:hypothetical protein